MNRTAKIRFIGEKLDELFPNPPIPLDYKDAYTMLVAVVLSAQCTDIRVNQVTKVLFKKADTPKKMVKLGIETIAGSGESRRFDFYGLCQITYSGSWAGAECLYQRHSE